MNVCVGVDTLDTHCTKSPDKLRLHTTTATSLALDTGSILAC